MAKSAIGVDLMGSDSSPDLLFSGVLEACENLGPSYEFVLFACEEVFSRHTMTPSMTPIIAESVITMDDEPLLAVRRKKDSSLCLGLEALRKKRIGAFLSAGNTGALVAASVLKLKRSPSIDRPALLAFLPTFERSFLLLDVGASLSFTAERLLECAVMGEKAAKEILKIEAPRLALLNIGVELAKGTKEIRRAHELLRSHYKDTGLFIGNVESRDIFRDVADVIITDGFTGNIVLKTVEGTSSLILSSLKEKLKEDSETLFPQFNYSNYPGGLLYGVEGLVMKCHGEGKKSAMTKSLLAAAHLLSSKA